MQISVELPPEINQEEGMAFLKEELNRHLGRLRCSAHREANTFKAGHIDGRAYRWRFHVCCEPFVKEIKSIFADMDDAVRERFPSSA